jgi:hypothetical protein
MVRWVFIVAGTMRLAAEAARRWDLKPSEWHYLSSDRILLGLHWSQVDVLYGPLYWEMPHWPEIKDRLDMMKAVNA